jgi:uncharacterized membrane protein YjgN (DUF898 family)
VISLYLAVPFAHQRIKRFQHTESRYGATQFSFDATVGSFYKIYLLGVLLFIGGFFLISLAFGATLGALFGMAGQHSGAGLSITMVILLIAIYAWMASLYPLLLTMMQNLIWNHTSLQDHRFHSDMKWGRLTFIVLTNLLGIMCTLGLFTPFAQVRFMKYKLESVQLLPSGSLDHFIAENESQVTAAGEGMTDLLDFDLSI